MRTPPINATLLVGLLTVLPAPILAGVEVVAASAATITPAGPRAGRNGAAYFNIQGKGVENPAFSSFGVLDFSIPKSEGAVKVESLSLSLTQSVARFSKDGKVAFFLTSDLKTEPSSLKFDPEKPGGVGDRIQGRLAVGSATFSKKKTGEVDLIPLSLDDAAKAFVADQLAKGSTLRVVIVPESPDVAATYFGAGQEKESSRPKLIIETTKP